MPDYDSHCLMQHKMERDPKMIGLWKVGRTIGKGSSGRVRIARHSKTGQYAAVKIISKTSLASQVSLNRLAEEVERTRLAVEREIVVMKLIDHPNIMRLYDVWETSTDLYLVLEYVRGGELFEYICKKGRLPNSEARHYFQQIISAVDYCHRFNIAHRDLKPENILLDQDFNIKVADFGMAAWQVNTEGGMLRTSCGSPHYAAPEIIDGGPYNGSAADIWSCGVILYALLHGRLPFEDDDLGALLEKVMKGSFVMPPHIEPLAQDLIGRMLTTEVDKRIAMSEIINHPFFTSQTPKIPASMAPSLDSIAIPITNRASIDPDIFANIRTLWHGTSDDDIIKSLTSDERNWQKGIYHLLVNYRKKYLESYAEEEEDIARERANRKKKKAMQAKANDLLTLNIPPRAGPPTPRSALRHHSKQSSSSEASVLAQRNPAAVKTEITLSVPTPLPGLSSDTKPRTMIVSTPLTVPDIQNDRVQEFFHHIANHLNVLQINNSNPPDAVTSIGQGTLEENTRTPLSDSLNDWVALDYHDRPTTFNDHKSGTQPLTLRRKKHLPQIDTGNKENITGSINRAQNPLTPREKPANQESVDMDLRKKIQILEPIRRKHSKLRKFKNPAPVSPAFSEAGSSFTNSLSPTSPFSSSPKRGWFGNVLRFKPVTHSILSARDLHTTRNECRRIIMNMDVRVSLEDSEGMGVLRCHAGGILNIGITATMKPTKFRVEVHEPAMRLKRQGYIVTLLLVHEKGSLDTFAEIFNALRREWTMDGGEATMTGPHTVSPSLLTSDVLQCMT